jgi:4-hydroxybutyrate CoA-transferase
MAQSVNIDDLPGLLKPGTRLFVPGSSGAPLAFMEALQSDLKHSRELRLFSSYVPGINALDMDRLHTSAQVTGLFMQPTLAQAQREGRYRHLPYSYGAFNRYLADHQAIDLLVVQVSPPDPHGRCSLGPAVEFVPTALRKSQRVLALINPHTPVIAGAVSLEPEQIHYQCEVSTALPTYNTRVDTAAQTIAQHIASLIDNGSALQIGLGRVPAALFSALTGHRGLRLFSGLLSDGMLELAQAGALDEHFVHSACVLLGSGPRFYREVSDMPNLRVAGCEIIHSPQLLAGMDSLVAVNSAVEVDLFGQCNLEHVQGRAISGAGGAPDFARGARMAHNGRSIIALNANHGESKGSRIVPSLSTTSIASLGRGDVDCIVTEFGIAQLSGLSVHERAAAIIRIADPKWRDALAASWRQIAERL